MQRFGALVRLGVAGVVVGGVCAACSVGFFDVGGIEFHLAGPDEFTQPQQEDAIPFTATGKPVDDGVVCDAGSVTVDRLESVDGETITVQEWADMFDTAMQDGGVVEMHAFQTFECGDGSGSFSMKVHSKYDFPGFEFEGEQDIGSWDIEGGTGSYSDLSGSGDVTLDWGHNDVKYDGDVS